MNKRRLFLTLAFALPSAYTEEIIPIPTNSAIKIVIHPEKTMTVLRLSGRSVETRLQKKKKYNNL